MTTDSRPSSRPRTHRIASATLDAWLDGGTLEVIAPHERSATLKIGASRVVVGRAPECDLAIDDPLVSLAHLELVPTARGVVLRDLGTTNGTRIGTLGVREVVLADGCEITIGNATLRFTYADKPSRVRAAAQDKFHGLVGGSPAMRALYSDLARLAPTKLNVLIEGETGTGKELVARAIHDASPRASAPFVVVDCGSLAPNLVESTLFGHEKGAFTGAAERRVGLVEAADGGTLFLDELGELPAEAQTRLLRVIEARTIRRVGAAREFPVDVRVVSATHRDLPAMIASGAFRADLFFRLATARVHNPPLRARTADIPALAATLLERSLGASSPVLTPAALEVLARKDYPGNVRELRNVLEVAAAFARGDVIDAEDVHRRSGEALDLRGPRLPRPHEVSTALATGSSGIGLYREEKERAVEAFDHAYFRQLIDETGGNLTHAAAKAGIERHHLRAILKKRGIAYRK